MAELLGNQQDESKRRRLECESARPFLRLWLKACEVEIRAGRLSEFVSRLSNKLTRYPSANVGKVWTGHERLAKDLGKGQSTIRAALKEMRDAKLLIRKRGGPGKTATNWFAIGGKRLFEIGVETPVERGKVVDFPQRRRRRVSFQESQKSSLLEGSDSSLLEGLDSSPKLLEQEHPPEPDPFEHHPPTPHGDRDGFAGRIARDRDFRSPKERRWAQAFDDVEGRLGVVNDGDTQHIHGAPCDETARSLATIGIEGEIVPVLSFPDFWNRSRGNAAESDKQGPARSEFARLSAGENKELLDLINRYGAIDLGGVWAVTWLRGRCWHDRRPAALDLTQHWKIRTGTMLALSRPIGQIAVIEHSPAFDAWCRHIREQRRITPFVRDVIADDGSIRRGFYMPTAFPPEDAGQ